MWDSHRFLNLVANALFILATAATGYYIYKHYDASRFYQIQTIHIQGMQTERVELKHTTQLQIERVVNNNVHGNFLSVDLVAVRDAFLALPWVRDAKVERAWPLALNVKLEEHHAIAHWGNQALVNTYGEVFRAVPDDRFPVFSGPMEANSAEVTEKYHLFNRILQPLQQSIIKIRLSSRHAWRLQLDSGTVVELGRIAMVERLRRYVSVYEDSIAQLDLDGMPAYVDLRYPNGFAIHATDVNKPLKKQEETINTRKET